MLFLVEAVEIIEYNDAGMESGSPINSCHEHVLKDFRAQAVPML